MFFRTRLLLVLIGVLGFGGFALMMYGYNEYKVGSRATPQPVEVALDQLEANPGQSLPDYHVQIGPHYACYYCTVYSYRTEKNAKPVDPHANLPSNTRLDYTFYPIVSANNPDAKAFDALKQKYGSLEKVPEDVDLPLPRHFAVLVKTARFRTVGDLPPAAIASQPEVHGLVINEISNLTTDEKKLIREEFPAIDLDKVLILEDGRKPFSTTTATLLMIGGACMMALGALVVCWVIAKWVLGMSGRTA